MPESMRAVVLHEQGGPENLKLEQVPVPEPGPGEVLVKTEAIGVSFTEAWLRGSTFPAPVPLPAVYGFEAAGIVTQTGAGVDESLAGQRVVIMSTSLGCYAEYAAVPASAVTAIPDTVTAADAIAVANFGAVAICLLNKAGLTGAETVLIEAAAGGVGGYLSQLAHRHGASRVIGTAGSPAKRDYARKLGADEVVDHTDPDWTAKLTDIDVVFESFAGDTTAKLIDGMTPNSGRFLLYGFIQGPPTITAMDLMRSGLTLIGCGAMLDQVRAATGDALALAASGQLRPQIDSTLPLEQAAQAHRRFDDRVAMGKVILVP